MSTKLYTKEQLHNTIKAIIEYLHDEKTASERIAKHLFCLKPIELPTEEEIEYQAEYHVTFAPSFKYGAEWVIDKIKKQQ